jgi:hypothetical protein
MVSGTYRNQGLEVVSYAGAEHHARLLGSGADQPGASSPRQPQDRCADGRVGELTFEGAPVLLTGQRGRVGFFEQGGLFAAQPVDLVTGFGEGDVAAGEPG